MPQRRRYATRAELVTLLVERTAISEGLIGAVLEALAAEGVTVDQLVKITVQEDLADGPS